MFASVRCDEYAAVWRLNISHPHRHALRPARPSLSSSPASVRPVPPAPPASPTPPAPGCGIVVVIHGSRHSSFRTGRRRKRRAIKVHQFSDLRQTNPQDSTYPRRQQQSQHSVPSQHALHGHQGRSPTPTSPHPTSPRPSQHRRLPIRNTHTKVHLSRTKPGNAHPRTRPRHKTQLHHHSHKVPTFKRHVIPHTSPKHTRYHTIRTHRHHTVPHQHQRSIPLKLFIKQSNHTTHNNHTYHQPCQRKQRITITNTRHHQHIKYSTKHSQLFQHNRQSSKQQLPLRHQPSSNRRSKERSSKTHQPTQSTKSTHNSSHKVLSSTEANTTTNTSPPQRRKSTNRHTTRHRPMSTATKHQRINQAMSTQEHQS